MPKTEPTDPISTPATARARRQPARPFSFDAIDFHAKWDGTLRGLQDIEPKGFCGCDHGCAGELKPIRGDTFRRHMMAQLRAEENLRNGHQVTEGVPCPPYFPAKRRQRARQRRHPGDGPFSQSNNAPPVDDNEPTSIRLDGTGDSIVFYNGAGMLCGWYRRHGVATRCWGTGTDESIPRLNLRCTPVQRVAYGGRWYTASNRYRQFCADVWDKGNLNLKHYPDSFFEMRPSSGTDQVPFNGSESLTGMLIRVYQHELKTTKTEDKPARRLLGQFLPLVQLSGTCGSELHQPAETKYWKARQAGSSFLVELDAPTLEGMRQVSCVAKTCEAQGSDPSEEVWVTQLVDGW